MKKFLLILLVLALAGCASVKPKPPQIVNVAVPVPCKIEPIEKPDMPTDKLKKTDNIYTKVQAAFAEIDIREGYEGQLEAAIKGCQ